MAEPTLADLYGIQAPAPAVDPDVAAARQRQQAAMTHAPANAPQTSAYQPVTRFGRRAAGLPEEPRPQLRADDVSDDELQANIEQADAVLGGQPPARVTPQGVIEGQMSGNVASQAGAYEQFLANLPTHASKANPRAPIVQRRFSERQDDSPESAALGYEQAYGGFQPVPFDASRYERYEDETDEQFAERMAMFEEIDLGEQRDRYERQKAADIEGAWTLGDTRDIGRAPGALGMEEAFRQGQENVDTATEEQATERARLEAIAAQEQREATEVAADAMEEQRLREEAGIQAVNQLRTLRDDTRKQLAAMPQVNRERVAKGLSQGTKVAAVLGAIAQGWRGDPITAVNDAIDRGVAEEMDKYARRQSELQDITAEADDAMGFLDYVTTSLGGNVRAGQQVLRSMRMEDAIADLAAKEAATNVPVIKAQLAQTRVALEKQLRDESDALELEYRTTPETIGVTIDTPWRKLMREEAKAQLKEGREEQRDLRKAYVGAASDDTKFARELELEGVKQEGAANAKRVEANAMGEKDIKLKSAAFGAVEQQIDDLLDNTGNIHGRGLAWTGSAEERIVTDSQLTALKQSLTQAFTGATATEEQQEAFARLIEGDWSELSDDALRARLRSLKNIVSSQRRYLQKELGPETKQAVSPRELSTFQPR